jgi:L-lactate utilization protein LutC
VNQHPHPEQPSDRPPTLDESILRRVQPTDDLTTRFCRNARQLGIHAAVCQTAQLVSSVRTILEQLTIEHDRPAVLVDPTLAANSSLPPLGELADVARILDPNEGDEVLFTADAAVTAVQAAVAETGSLVCTSGPNLWRGLSLIPPAHIAVIQENQIVPDLMDLMGGLATTNIPASVTLISGPSKTADIENILITGVHGPGQVHALVIPESACAS